ncbi:MAG: phosphate propanoyltransferase [Ruminiclostridium sp.]|nr:phosphate propanoyltransferase [Ruminiclostridium sp.]
MSQCNGFINVGISNRHVHLSSNHRDVLFGEGSCLTQIKSLSQKGQFAAKECVTLIGLKGSIEGVRVLGPERTETQVEISVTDMYKLGVDAPVRDSGDLAGTPGIILLGPKGMVSLKSGVICAKRHIHASPEDALYFNVKDRQEVLVFTMGERGLLFCNVLVRVHESFTLEFHLDTDEANAAGLKNNDKVRILI